MQPGRMIYHWLSETDSQIALDDAEKYLVTCNGVKWFALVAFALTSI